MIVPPWVYAACGLGLLAAGFAGGWTVRDWRCDAAELRRLEAQQRAEAVSRKAGDDAAAGFEDQRAAIDATHQRLRTEIREIYREVPVPAHCTVRDDAVDVLQRARDAANRAAAGESVGPMSAAAAAAAADDRP